MWPIFEDLTNVTTLMMMAMASSTGARVLTSAAYIQRATFQRGTETGSAVTHPTSPLFVSQMKALAETFRL